MMESKAAAPDATTPLGASFVGEEKSAQAACYAGDNPRLQVLAQLGLDWCMVDADGRTLFHWAAAGGKSMALLMEVHAEMAKTWDEAGKGGKFEDHKDDDGWAPLTSAVSAGHTEVVTWLVEACGVDCSTTTSRGQTALHYAKGVEPILELLMPRVANIDHADHTGATVRSSACFVPAALCHVTCGCSPWNERGRDRGIGRGRDDCREWFVGGSLSVLSVD